MDIETVAAIITIVMAMMALFQWVHRRYRKPIRKWVVSFLRSLKEDVEKQGDNDGSK